jgi:hypothetical protein
MAVLPLEQPHLEYQQEMKREIESPPDALRQVQDVARKLLLADFIDLRIVLQAILVWR